MTNVEDIMRRCAVDVKRIAVETCINVVLSHKKTLLSGYGISEMQLAKNEAIDEIVSSLRRI